MSDGAAAETVEPTDDGAAGAVVTSRETESPGTDVPSSPPWFRSSLGLLVLAVDLGLLVALVVASTGLLGDVLESNAVVGFGDTAAVPGYVYVFAALGALGYVFTGLVTDFRRDATDLLRMTLRIPAALPLAAGLFLLAGQFMGGQFPGTGPPTRLMAGLSFVAGLFVNLTYERIASLAKRLLPAEESGEQSERDTVPDGDADGSTADDGTGDETGRS